MFGIFGPKVPQVSGHEVAEQLRSGQAPVIIDVREPGEYAGGHIPGSKPIPLGSLQGRLAEIPKDRELVVVCLSGGRSAQATKILLSEGYQAKNLVGGMMGWRGPVER